MDSGQLVGQITDKNSINPAAKYNYSDVLNIDVSEIEPTEELINSGGHADIYKCNNEKIVVKVYKHVPHVDDWVFAELSIKYALSKQQCIDNNIVYLLKVDNKTLYHPAGKCDLHQYIVGRAGQITNEHSGQIFEQCTKAVKFLHSRSIVHFDISADNFILFDDNIFRLTDFGLAEQVYSLIDAKLKYPGDIYKPLYRAPELLEKKNYYPRKTDIWALGVVFYFVHYAEFPFDVKEESDISEYDLLVLIKKGAPKELLPPCNNMLAELPADRTF